MMLEQGVIRATSTGLYTLLPLGMRALKKLENIVDRYMEMVGAQKILLPTLTSDKLWEQSGMRCQIFINFLCRFYGNFIPA